MKYILELKNELNECLGNWIVETDQTIILNENDSWNLNAEYSHDELIAEIAMSIDMSDQADKDQEKETAKFEAEQEAKLLAEERVQDDEEEEEDEDEDEDEDVFEHPMSADDQPTDDERDRAEAEEYKAQVKDSLKDADVGEWCKYSTAFCKSLKRFVSLNRIDRNYKGEAIYRCSYLTSENSTVFISCMETELEQFTF